MSELEEGTRNVSTGAGYVPQLKEVGIRVFAGLLGGGIGNGVLEAAGFAKLDSAHGVDGVNEEGAGSCCKHKTRATDGQLPN